MSSGDVFFNNLIIFGVYNSSFLHADNRKKDILILSKGPTDGLDDTTVTAKAGYSINFTEQQQNFFLSLHFSESNWYLLVNVVKIYQFKVKTPK